MSKQSSKLSRGDKQTQAQPDAQKKRAPNMPGPSEGQMPELGAAGMPMTGSWAGGAKPNPSQLDPAAKAAQDKELARVKALPAGDPELKEKVSPKAAGQKVEGQEGSGAARSESESQAPEQVKGADAQVGPSADAPSKTEPGGAALAAQSGSGPDKVGDKLKTPDTSASGASKAEELLSSVQPPDVSGMPKPDMSLQDAAQREPREAGAAAGGAQGSAGRAGPSGAAKDGPQAQSIGGEAGARAGRGAQKEDGAETEGAEIQAKGKTAETEARSVQDEAGKQGEALGGQALEAATEALDGAGAAEAESQALGEAAEVEAQTEETAKQVESGEGVRQFGAEGAQADKTARSAESAESAAPARAEEASSREGAKQAAGRGDAAAAGGGSLLGSLGDGVSGLVDGAMDEAKGQVDGAMDRGRQLVEGKLGQAAGELQGAVGGGLDQLQGAVGSSGLARGIDKIAGEGTAGKLLGQGRGKVDEAVGGAVGQVQGQIDGAIGQARGQVDDLMNQGQQKVSGALGGLFGGLGLGGGKSKGGASRAGAGRAAQGAQQAGHSGGGGDVEQELRGKLGGGRQLPGAEREKFEQGFGTDLSKVRVHDDAAAQGAAESIGAQAFAMGNDIFLGKGAGSKPEIMAEELAHVVQTKGEQALREGAKGVSEFADKAEAQAREAAQKVLRGAEALGLKNDNKRRAIHRAEDKTTEGQKSKIPRSVAVRMGGKQTSVAIPQQAPDTETVRVGLISIGIPGLTVANGEFHFDKTTGQMRTGKARATMNAGGMIMHEGADVQIEPSGNMTSTFTGSRLVGGNVLDTKVTVNVVDGVLQASGTAGTKDVKLPGGIELKSASLQVKGDSNLNYSATGKVAFDIAGFGEAKGTIKVSNGDMSGTINAGVTSPIPLGPGANITAGSAQGTLDKDGKVTLDGSLTIEAPAIGKGTLTANYASPPGKVQGNATFDLTQPKTVGPATLTSGHLEGVVKDSELRTVSGTAKGTFGDLLEGSLTGKLDIPSTKLDGTAKVKLARPITKGPVEISKGSLTAKLNDNQVKSISGKADFKLSDVAKGDITLLPETNLTTLHGTATARLARTLKAGDISVTDGTATIQVDDASAKLVSAELGLQYKYLAKGTLSATSSKNFETFSGAAHAELMRPITTGKLSIKEGTVDMDVTDNAVASLRGDVGYDYDGLVAGRIKAEAKQDFTQVSGSATGVLQRPIEAGEVKIDKGNLQLKFNNDKPVQFGGSARVKWREAEGTITIDKRSTLESITGKADVKWKGDLNVGEIVLHNPHLIVDVKANEFAGFGGDSKYTWNPWLEGDITIARGSKLDAITGEATGSLLQPIEKEGFKISKGNVKVRVAASKLKDITGSADFEYKDLVKGKARLLAGTTLDNVNAKVSGKLTKEVQAGEFKITEGKVAVSVKQNKPALDAGDLAFKYSDMASGTLHVTSSQNFEKFSGTANAKLDRAIKAEKLSVTEGSLEAKVESNVLTEASVAGKFAYDALLSGTIEGKATDNFKKMSGKATGTLLKPLTFGEVVVDKGTLQVKLANNKPTSFGGSARVKWRQAEGTITIDKRSTLESVTGSADVKWKGDIPIGIATLKTPHLIVDVKDNKFAGFGGDARVAIKDWGEGDITIDRGSTFEKVSGDASFKLTQPKKIGSKVTLTGGLLQAHLANNRIDSFSGNADFDVAEIAKGTIAIRKGSTDKSISGDGTVELTRELGNAYAKITKGKLHVAFEANEIKSFDGEAAVKVADIAKGVIDIHKGSTFEKISGDAKVGLVKEMGNEWVKLKKGGEVGMAVRNNQVKEIWGHATVQVKDYAEGTIEVDRGSTWEHVSGTAGVKLIKEMGTSLAKITGGEVKMWVKDNQVDHIGGWASVQVTDLAKGKVTIEETSKFDAIDGKAEGELTKQLGKPPVKITKGKVAIELKKSEVTALSGELVAEVDTFGEGTIKGTYDLKSQEFSGSGTLKQKTPFDVKVAKITDGELTANIDKNKLTSASGKAKIDAGKIGQGAFQVNYADEGGVGVFWGEGKVAFKPHDRVTGDVTVRLSKEQKFTGEGNVHVKITDKITGDAQVALDEQGHVKLKGAVRMPGPYEIFKMTPYKKDMTLLKAGFPVWTPPMVKVFVDAGFGIEAGIKPLTLSNVVVAGEVDLMQPEFAGMSVTGTLSSEAYADLNAYIDGGVQVSAAVVAVRAGLKATLNLHLAAALRATPTITVNRAGLSFDMPVSADVTAALNLLLEFYAKVRVGLDVGLFSIMKTVWNYPFAKKTLPIAQMGIGLKGNVHAGADGLRGSMTPTYSPPTLTLDKLKGALGI